MHDHSHHHHHNHGQHSTHRVLLIAIVSTLVFAFIEALAGLGAHSLALLSDAGHMLSDSLALSVAAFAAWLSKKPPSIKYSYGLGRSEVMGAWISSLIMLILCLSILLEAIKRLHSPINVNSMPVMLVGGLGLLMNLFIAYMLSRGEKNLNTRAAMLHVLSDLLGSVAALTAGIVIYFFHFQAIDPILSIVISILILYSTIQLLRETLIVLMESVPKHLNLQHIENALKKNPNIYHIHDLHVWNLSSGQTLLTAHVEIDNLEVWPDTLQQIQHQLDHEFHISHITLQPELITHPMAFHPPKSKKGSP